MSLVVHDPTVEGSTIECEITPPRHLRRFFSGEPFRVEYDVDLEGLPTEIATIPALAHVCPVAWANGVDVEVSAVDETFLQSLEEVREVLGRMYPSFIEGGEIRVGEVVDTRADRSPDEFDDSGLLFSGGIDSVASYVRQREETPTLISIQGWVVGVEQDDRWEGAMTHIDTFAADRGLDVQNVRSNMLSCLDMPMLQAHYKRYVDGAWYSSVGHGIGLVALCAPLSHALGLGTIHIASSHTDEFDQPWGSHPSIDDNVRWTYTSGNHDGYVLSRQKKVELIADYAETEAETFPIRTCVHADRGGNCNECEKCYRTMVGMVLAGLDPNRFGYEMDERTFHEVREGFERRTFVMDDHTVFHWRDIQDHVRYDREFPVDSATEFFQWLETVDIDSITESATEATHRKVIRGVARNIPYPVYNSLYPVYGSLKKRI
ncbi:hypothetical protein [Natronorubrum texcoconense]|uniref:7-cyano-7-deazaguanine synthase (Queuosine biosynthesis) n=1 Tax=Natronorubrum texcoconense TaxID=1095776 RepID=A0A1G8UPJ8_9EURY|nr:hypothetical protein [Natronorubrum texcoconense]SDJ55806.1 hypothetical protein SAMN04515672_0980 [Natronorubrum texcoconense]